MNLDSYHAMLSAVRAFHEKHQLNASGGESLPYRVALMAEELGEISACVTKGQGTQQLSEECADLLILLIGTAISANFDLNAAFWDKIKILEKRTSRNIGGMVRISEFDE